MRFQSLVVFVLTVITVLAWGATQTYAVGIAVTPSEIIIEALVGKDTMSRLNIENPSSDVAIFEIYPDEFQSDISVTPSSFTLESGESRYVSITIKTRREGQSHTTLSAIARPMATNAFQAGSGIKIPITITATQSRGLASLIEAISDWKSLRVFALVGLVLGALGLVYSSRRRTSR